MDWVIVWRNINIDSKDGYYWNVRKCQVYKLDGREEGGEGRWRERVSGGSG